MKITIEPSAGPDAAYFSSVTIDTGNNNETTSEALTAAANGLIAYGHHLENIKSACAEIATEPE